MQIIRAKPQAYSESAMSQSLDEFIIWRDRSDDLGPVDNEIQGILRRIEFLRNRGVVFDHPAYSNVSSHAKPFAHFE